MILIDTNILLYATVGGFEEHSRAREFLDEAVSGDVQHCLCWVSVFEYLRAATHPRLLRPAALPLGKAVENIEGLLAQPRISRIDPGPHHLELFREICEEAAPVAGSFVFDCRIAAIMREHGVDRIATRDTSFRRIPGITVVDPLTVPAAGEAS